MTWTLVAQITVIVLVITAAVFVLTAAVAGIKESGKK